MNQTKMQRSELSRSGWADIANKWTAVPVCAVETFVSSIPSRILEGAEIQSATQMERTYSKRFKPKIESIGNVGVVTIEGAISRKVGLYEAIYFDTFDLQWAEEDLNALKNESAIQGIVLRMDTPGGVVTGVPELAELVRKISKVKPVVAYGDGMIASAGYWIASQAHSIISSESTENGSIGVYTAFVDWSEYYKNLGVSVSVIRNEGGTYKGQGVRGTSLSKEYLEHLTLSVNSIFNDFKSAVLRQRKVKATAFQGQTYAGASAKEVGLIDAVGSMDLAVAQVKKLIREQKAR